MFLSARLKHSRRVHFRVSVAKVLRVRLGALLRQVNNLQVLIREAGPSYGRHRQLLVARQRGRLQLQPFALLVSQGQLADWHAVVLFVLARALAVRPRARVLLLQLLAHLVGSALALVVRQEAAATVAASTALQHHRGLHAH